MFQVLLDKTADWLFPVILGMGVWYGLHYALLTPRIMRVDLPAAYQDFHLTHGVSKTVGACVQENITGVLLQHGRMEAALHTASLGHIREPFDEELQRAEARLDEICVISQDARQRQERETASKKLQLEREMQERYQQQIKHQLNFFIDLLTGDK